MPSKLVCLFFLFSLTFNFCVCMNEEEQKEAMEKIIRELTARNLRTSGGASSSTGRRPPVSSADLSRIIGEQGFGTPTPGQTVSSADLSRIIGAKGSRTPGHTVSSADLSRIIGQHGSGTSSNRTGHTVSSADLSRIIGAKGSRTPGHAVSSADLSRIIGQHGSGTSSNRTGHTVSSADLSRIIHQQESGSPIQRHTVSSADLSRIIGQQSSGTSQNKRILMIAPNFLTNHFKFNALLADLLVNYGHQVHFLILNTGEEPEPKAGGSITAKDPGVKSAEFAEFVATSPGKKIFAENHPKGGSWEFVNFDKEFLRRVRDEGTEEKLGNKWRQRAFTQHKQILRNEAFLVFKEFIEKHAAVIKRLNKAKFDIAIVDLWDFGALQLLFLTGIRNAIGINKIQLQSFQMEYAGTLGQLPTNIPEVYATQIGDGHANMDRLNKFEGEHKRSIGIFEQIHREMDVWFMEGELKFVEEFPWLLKWKGKWPKVRDLYTGLIKHLLVNSAEMADFPLDGGKPANMHYFGGIHLDGTLKKLKVKRTHGRGDVIVSLKGCAKMLDKENRNAFDAFMSAFGKFGQFKFIFDCREFEKKNPPAENIEFRAIEKFQNELARPDVRVLISNCGSSSAIEAMAAGIPLICVPFSVDQFYIGEALALPLLDDRNGAARLPVAISLDINQITATGDSHKIVEALGKMLSTEVYLENARRMREKLHEKWDKNGRPEHMFLELVNSTA